MTPVKLSDGNFAFKQGNTILGKTVESVNGIGFGYTYDIGTKESLCFYSNNEPWIKAEAVIRLRKRLMEN